MAATATYNPATRVLAVASDGLPRPVSYGTFPNNNNPNTVQEQDFDHDFIYRGGQFGTSRTFDDASYTHDGFIRTITLSVNDLTLFTPPATASIRPGDRILFVFGNGDKRVFLFKGTDFTSLAGECWLASDDALELIMDEQESTPVTGTYEYFDQRESRQATPLGQIGVTSNGVAIFNPSAGTGGNPPSGFSWVAAGENPFISFGEDNCGGHPEQTGQYHYHDTHFLDCWREGASIASYNDYYGTTQFNGDNIRHPDGHSKIVGIAFDGFPVYGPYGYTTPWDSLSGIRTMTSSFSVRDTEAPGRPDYGIDQDNPPAGTLMEDYEYIEGSGDLDSHNGRFCVTPEYPNGTYAYFLSVDEEDADEPVFPFLIGLSTRMPIDTSFTRTTVVAPPPGGGGGEPPVLPTLQFTLQPANATVNVGQTATFTIQAQVLPENGPIGYQWYRSTDGGFAFAAITGATTNEYSITALAYMTGYKYRCRITGPQPENNASNSPLDSVAVTLTVAGQGGGGDTNNRFDSTSSTFDSTSQTFDGT